jgi:streptomycin 6-kinase
VRAVSASHNGHVQPLEVPDLVVQRASSSGAAGTRWLAELPDVVADLSSRWGLTLGAAFAGGTSGYVVAATDSSGRACVLKIAMPLDADEHESFMRSVRAHELAGGKGCAQLLTHDVSAPAMLLERLGPNLAELGMDTPAILEALAATLQSFWRPISFDHGLRTGEQQARWLADYIETTWEELGRPCEEVVVDRAVALCERRAAAFDPARAVLVHGDAHGWNTLDAGNGIYKFVDAEGLFSEREHDLGVAMREYNEPLIGGDTRRLVRERAEMLARRCAVDPQAVWEWGFIERVSTGLANVRHFDNDDGAIFLEVARRSM